MCIRDRCHIRHNKAQAVEDSPGDTDSFEPGAAFIHRPSGTGEVHEQQGYRSSDDGGDSGDGKDLDVYKRQEFGGRDMVDLTVAPFGKVLSHNLLCPDGERLYSTFISAEQVIAVSYTHLTI